MNLQENSLPYTEALLIIYPAIILQKVYLKVTKFSDFCV